MRGRADCRGQGDRVNDQTDLICGYFDGALSDSEVVSLNNWIVEDPENARIFAKHAVVHSEIHEKLVGERSLELEEERFVDARRTERSISAVLRQTAAKPKKSFPWHPIFKFAGTASAAAILVICGMLVWNYMRPQPGSTSAGVDDDMGMDANAPAFITADAGAVWKGLSGNHQRSLAAGNQLTLSDGYAELTFSAGAKVLVESPATFTIDSGTAVSLASGKLSATVIGGGFVVKTPVAQVTDLGTEFGVNVQDASKTEVEVFKGKVRLEGLKGSGTGARPVDTLLLNAGQAATFSKGELGLSEDVASPKHFVRSIAAVTTSLDVIDLICGGNGTNHRRGMGIDIVTGESGALKQVGREAGDDLYHPVPGVPVVDGCFLPDGKEGATQVDSAGHTFQFPVTSKLSQGLLWAGGRMLSPFGNGLAGSALGGVDYSEPEHGVLYMYSNKGITLDLKKIGHLYAQRNFYEFRCTVGNTYTKMSPLQRRFPKSDVYVMVDGELRFRRKGFTAKAGPFTLEVPLRESDHYLTLVTTDGGDTRKDDYIIWGDPSLEMMVPSMKGAEEESP